MADTSTKDKNDHGTDTSQTSSAKSPLSARGGSKG